MTFRQIWPNTLRLLRSSVDLAGVFASANLHRAEPGTKGIKRLTGLSNRVDVIRDRWGVPHIYGKTNPDIFISLGYIHAQDRLWQMDMNRRAASGKLSEIFGSKTINSDRFARVLGLNRIAYQEVDLLDDITRDLITAYITGINSFLEINDNHLPIEFAIFGYKPKPWDIVDVLAFNKLMALYMCGNWTTELFNARVTAILGEQRAKELNPQYADDHPLTVHLNHNYQPGISDAIMRTLSDTRPFLGYTGIQQGSNAWAVGCNRSATGHPLLANDPHMELALPSFWYEAHLEGGSFAVTGATLPGTPGILIGHNKCIAWGITNAMTDVQDLYIENFHPENPMLYEWCGGWEHAKIIQEEIKVRDQQDPFIENVLITRHGPVITPVATPLGSQLQPGQTIALRWTALEPTSKMNRAVFCLNQANNWNEFRAALEDWDSPPQNFVYADVDGHFGYVLAGKMPIRASGDGGLPMSGSSGNQEWIGYIPSHSLPACYDPPEGFVVTANNKIASNDVLFSLNLHGDWLNGYRALRITEMLKGTEHHTIKSFGYIQNDKRSIPSLELAKLFNLTLRKDPLVAGVGKIFESWDGDLSSESIGGTIYTTFRYHLERCAYLDIKDLCQAFAGLGVFDLLPSNDYFSRVLPGILIRIKATQDLFQPDPWLGNNRTWMQVLDESVALTVNELCHRLGENPHQWRYGRIHSLRLYHKLGALPLIGLIFNRGPWQTGGDIDTICKGYTTHVSASDSFYIGPSYRQICDTSNWDASCSILSSGQSGNVASAHYCDMVESWLSGSYHPMLWKREKVDQYAMARLVLEPE